MDARIKFAVIAVAIACLGANHSTKNFVVIAPDPNLAKQVGLAAEKYRRELAIEWLGHELPDWTEKCPIRVSLSAHAGGQTSFGFVTNGSESVPVGWDMEIFGSPERILDSVLPHEITHTIFATHFGRPLPRWADEGACTTVEHESERNKNHQLLMRYLRTNRGIPFNKMFAMKQYPHDIYPLYAQGYSLARFLILQGGKRHFIDYIGAGMAAEVSGDIPRAWDATTEKFYGFDDLSELQVRWIGWVKQGCPDLPDQAATAVAAATPASSPENRATPIPATTYASNNSSPATVSGSISWYINQANGTASSETPTAPVEAAAPKTAGPNSYRPGTTRAGEAIEVLATISTDSVNTNRVQPESVYYARPEIDRSREAGPTIWR
jgi:hypothetical protein